MIKFDFEGKEYQMVTDWEEMTMGQFLNVTKIQKKYEVLPVGEELLAQQLIEALSNAELGEFDEMTIKQLESLAPYVKDLESKYETFSKNNQKAPDHWEIDGRIFSYRRNPNECTAGEIVDIKTYIGESQQEFEYMLDVAAVLIRPAELKHSEAGTPYYHLTKRHPMDHDRLKSIISTMRFGDVSKVLSFFLSGWLTQMIDTNASTGIKDLSAVEEALQSQLSLEP